MKLVSFVSFKGGAGKTTALMAVASALAERGQRFAILEADENYPLRDWQDDATDIGIWDAGACSIMPAGSERDLERSFEAAEQAGCDLALVDTAGGGSDLNTTVMVNSELVIIPTALTTIDLDAALETFDFAAQVYEAQGAETPTRLLVTRMNTGRLALSERASLEVIAEVPQLETKLMSRNAFADLKSIGMLHLYHARLLAIPAKRIAAGHINAARIEARALADEILALI